MYITNQREGGRYAVETHQELKQDYSGYHFDVAKCAVVYGDKDAASHCVRLFVVDGKGL